MTMGATSVLSGEARWALIEGDCLDMLRTLPDASVDAVVTDPPSGISFMGKAWDSDKGGRDEWIAWLAGIMAECLRVLKPGGHALVWALPRTSHWTGMAIEDAGFEIRDKVLHIQGSGFPKSIDVQYHSLLENGVCLSKDPVPHVAPVSPWLRLESSGGRGRIAVALARIPQEEGPGLLMATGRVGASPVAMAISPSLLRGAGTFLNTGLSWRELWAVFSDQTRTSITSTEIAAIIDAEILNYAVGQIISKSIMHRKQTRAGGCRCPAYPVALSWNGSEAQSEETPTCFVQESASGEALSYEDWERALLRAVSGTNEDAWYRARVAAMGGLGSATKPAYEDWWLARKPLDGTVAQNVLTHGTGALNVDGCRVGTDHRINAPAANKSGGVSLNMSVTGMPQDAAARSVDGRWPPHLALTHHPDCTDICTPDCPVEEMGRQSGERTIGSRAEGVREGMGYHGASGDGGPEIEGSTGTAARYFPRFRYMPKPSTAEREFGVTREPGTARETVGRDPDSDGAQNPRAGAGRGAGAPVYRCEACGLHLGGGRAATACPDTEDGKHQRVQDGTTGGRRNIHPTLKPIGLMRWLCRLITPPGGVILDPFAGSGTTGCAAMLEGFRFIGCDLEPVHAEIARDRIAAWANVDPATVTGEDGDTTRTPRAEEPDERQISLFGDNQG